MKPITQEAYNAHMTRAASSIKATSPEKERRYWKREIAKANAILKAAGAK